jgi:hypothetical protein
MKDIRARLLAFSAILALSTSTAAAEESSQRIIELERKVDDLTSVIKQQQQLIEKLLKQEGIQTDGSSSQSSGNNQADRGQSRPGIVSGMQMSACPLKLGSDRRLPDACQGLPPATVTVSTSDTFAFDAALKENKLASYLRFNEGGVVGLRWTGLLSIEKAGEHQFQMALGYQGEGFAARVTCRSVLRLVDREIVNTFAEFVSDRNNPVNSEQGKQSLEPGIYEMEVFMSCGAAYDRLRTIINDPDMTKFLDGVRVTLSYAEPGGKSFKPIPEDRIGVAP